MITPKNINSLHCKFKKKRNVNIKKEILNYINLSEPYHGFSLKYKYCIENKLINAKLLLNKKETTYNYMDPYVRKVCTIIAHELRDYIGNNIFFDLKDGEINFYI